MVQAYAQATNSTCARLRREELTEHLVHRLSRVRDAQDRQRLREEIVLLNTPVAEAVASRYRNRGAEYEDLLQVARMALVKALDRYDHRRGTGFVGFAVPTIRGEVKRYFRDQCWSIRPTRRIQELQQAIQRAEPGLTQALGRAPRAVELAAEIGVAEDDVIEALACDGFFHLLPLDAPGGGESSPAMAEQVGDCDRHLEWVETHETLRPALTDLSERERLMLRLRFDEGFTQSEIADRLGISQMQVSRLLNALYLRLRDRLEPESAHALSR
jgi:RNA polymerase sigma-B factor